MVRAAGSTRRRRRESGRRHVPPLAEVAAAFRERDLFTYSSALAYRVLVSLVPLTLLGLALLAVVGAADVWRDQIGPSVEERVTLPVYHGIDYSVERIFAHSAWPLVAIASLLALWHVARGMRIVMKALNAIHGTKEDRSARRLAATDVALALVLIVSLVAAFLVVVLLPRTVGDGLASAALHVLAWLVAAVLLAAAVGILMRYAPAEHPEPRWASAGSLLVVVTWVIASAAFAWWAGSVANYKSAAGALLVFVVLTTYVLVSTSIFLVGAQLDELARKGHK